MISHCHEGSVQVSISWLVVKFFFGHHIIYNPPASSYYANTANVHILFAKTINLAEFVPWKDDTILITIEIIEDRI